MIIFIIAFLGLIVLLALHEFSHFLAAKAFGITVEEFGIGYPPKLCGKKIGGTFYSLNLIPFGAFVRIPDPELRAHSGWQRFIVLFAGIISFWVFCALLLSIVFIIGAPVAIDDNETGFENVRIQVVEVAPDSPAAQAGLNPGDFVSIAGEVVENKTSEFQKYIADHQGEAIIIEVVRGSQSFTVEVEPRLDPPPGEGSLGVALVRTGISSYPFFKAIFMGARETVRLTGMIVFSLSLALRNLFLRRPTGVELVGPVGILKVYAQAGGAGISSFLQTTALISLHLAIFNALPLPVADGGRVMFLALEKIFKKPLNEKTEEKVINVFFFLLLGIMAWVTVKDIIKLF